MWVKKKTNSQSAEFTASGFSVKEGEVYLAKIGTIKLIWSRELPSEPSSVRVIKDCANRYLLSFVVEVEPNITVAKNQSIGIDLGVKTFAVMSNGEKALSPSYSKHDRKIRKLHRWGKIDLSVRSILCLSCGTEQERDENASRNIEMVGMGHRHDLKRTGSDCKTVTDCELL